MALLPPRVLILGGTGMLGSVLWGHLSSVPGWKVRRSQRRNPAAPDYFDALAPAEPLDALLADVGGTDYVVNAIGLTQAELREGDAASAAAADAINVKLPHRLAAAAARAGARVIQVSTDGVFSGKNGLYDEFSAPDPEDLYGRTKLAGELIGPRILVLRCSLVGPDPEKHRGLFEWFRQFRPGAHVRGFTDQRWNGVTTLQLAELCRELVQRGLFDQVTATGSIRHFCPNRPVTKYELLRIFNEALHANVVIRPVESGAHVDRVLVSRWDDLNTIAGGPTEMADAIRAMVRTISPTSAPFGKAHGRH